MCTSHKVRGLFGPFGAFRVGKVKEEPEREREEETTLFMCQEATKKNKKEEVFVFN